MAYAEKMVSIETKKNNSVEGQVKLNMSGSESAPEKFASKPCTKKKNCRGAMTWNPKFRALKAPATGHVIYRPAWVCDTCGRHDYGRGMRY